MLRWGVIYEYSAKRPGQKRRGFFRLIALGLIALSLGGITGPLTPALRLEASYYMRTIRDAAALAVNPPKPLPKSVPVVFNPLVTEDGSSIAPVNTDFSIIVPKIGVNAPIIASVDPANPGEYLEALKAGVAHAASSYTPDKGGTTYLFSHSTNYDWFVKDLNAVFYLLKNLNEGDLIVLFYQGTRYTYRLTGKRIVSPRDISYLVPQAGKKQLILQTCWPPGSTTERLLLFADLVEEYSQTI